MFDYYDTLKRIELKQEEILHPFNEFPDENTGAGSNSVMTISDPTAKTGSILAEEKELKRMREIVRAIHKVYHRLIDEKKEVIKLYYWDRPGELTWDGVAQETGTSRATALRWRKGFILKVARELGER